MLKGGRARDVATSARNVAVSGDGLDADSYDVDGRALRERASNARAEELQLPALRSKKAAYRR